MTLTDLYPPIVVATVVAGLWFIVAYRLNKRDTPGHESWALILWLLTGPLLVLAFFYTGFGLEPGDPLYTFFAALTSVGMGIGFLGGLSVGLRPSLKAAARAYFIACFSVIMVMFTSFLFL